MTSNQHYLSNQQLIEVFTQTKTATAIHVGEDAVIQTANDAMLAIWGKDRSVIGKSLEDALPELKGQPFIDMFRTVWLEGLTISGSDTAADLVVNGKKQTFYFDFEYRAIKDAAGKVICILHSAVDVTERYLKWKAIEEGQEKAEALAREQALNEELAAANEELGSINEELQQAQESLRTINNELEKRVEDRVKELTESEARFRTMAEGTDILIAVGDETGNATYFNNAWMKVTGRSMGDLLEFGWADLIHPDDKDAFVNIFLSAFEKKTPFAGEFRVLDKKGDYRWLLANGPPRFNPDGSFAGYISSCIDITERKRIEEEQQQTSAELQAINEEIVSGNEELASTNEELAATNEELIETQQQLQSLVLELADSEERFRTLALQAPVGICMIKGDPFYVEVVNDTFLELIRRERSDFDGVSYWGAIPEVASLYEPITRSVIETGMPYYANEHEFKLMRNGVMETLFVDFVYQPVKNPDGSADTILIVANEVTEQVLSRRKVEQAEEMLRFSVEAANAATWYLNVDSREFITSAKLKEIFGFDTDRDITYDDILSRIPADYQELIHKTIQKSIALGETYTMEHPILYNDGRQRWVRALGKLYNATGDKEAHFSGLIIDITDQKNNEIRKNDFIGMVSHELKTPLTSLTAIVQVLNMKLKTHEDAFIAGALDKANTQVKKMSNMINGFLNISRLESGKIQIIKTDFDVDDLVNEMIDDMMVTISSHIIFNGCKGVLVHADKDKIGSVISNLLSNAVKYSPKNTPIEVSCLTSDSHVQISVKDTGIGVKAEELNKLFDRYYRVESSTTQHISGFGIGLYLSAEIIQHHNGKIWAESEFGNGSTFTFSIPLK